MNISEVGKRAGLPPKTIRFYEDIGLITPARQENGYRVFSRRELERLVFLRRARSLGFSVGECRHLLDLYQNQDRASADVKRLARDHLQRVDAQLAELAKMRATLAALVDACSGDTGPACPILEDLSRE